MNGAVALAGHAVPKSCEGITHRCVQVLGVWNAVHVANEKGARWSSSLISDIHCRQGKDALGRGHPGGASSIFFLHGRGDTHSPPFAHPEKIFRERNPEVWLRPL